MKELEKMFDKLKEFRVFRENECFSYEEDIVILRSEEIEIKRICETYGKYGQKSCCYDAGCYSLENCDCQDQVLRDILAVLKITLTEEEKKELDFEEIVEKYSKIEGFETAKEEVEQHIECECYEYWDGSNFRSITIKNDDFEADLNELHDDESEKILTEYNAVRGELSYIEGRDKAVSSGKYSFFTSRMQGFYPVAVVEEEEQYE